MIASPCSPAVVEEAKPAPETTVTEATTRGEPSVESLPTPQQQNVKVKKRITIPGGGAITQAGQGLPPRPPPRPGVVKNTLRIGLGNDPRSDLLADPDRDRRLDHTLPTAAVMTAMTEGGGEEVGIRIKPRPPPRAVAKGGVMGGSQTVAILRMLRLGKGGRGEGVVTAERGEEGGERDTATATLALRSMEGEILV